MLGLIWEVDEDSVLGRFSCLVTEVNLFFFQLCIIFPVPLRVYGPAESQQAVFGDVCPLLTSLLDG